MCNVSCIQSRHVAPIPLSLRPIWATLFMPILPVAAGPSTCPLLPIVTKDGKTMTNGKLAYCGAIRSKDPIVCALRALSYHLIHRFTIKGEPFPNPEDREAWVHTALFPGRTPRDIISYEQLYASVVGVFAAVGITVAKKTHAFRVAGARCMDEAGVDDQVCA